MTFGKHLRCFLLDSRNSRRPAIDSKVEKKQFCTQLCCCWSHVTQDREYVSHQIVLIGANSHLHSFPLSLSLRESRVNIDVEQLSIAACFCPHSGTLVVIQTVLDSGHVMYTEYP